MTRRKNPTNNRVKNEESGLSIIIFHSRKRKMHALRKLEKQLFK